MIQITNPEQWSEIKVEYHQPSGRGWSLIAVVHETTQDTREFYDDKGKWVTESIGEKIIPVYIMGRKEPEIFAEIQAQLDAALEDAKTANYQLEKAKEDYKAAVSRIEQAETELRVSEGDVLIFKTRLCEIEQSKNQMEHDLSKLRNALGEIQFNEILGEAGSANWGK